jgi:hypothetical protein
MAAAAREFLMLVQESAFKTPVASPVVWTTALTYDTETAAYLRLDEGNAFTMRPKPQMVEVPYGGGFAVGAYRVADKLEVKGNLRVKLTAGLAPFLLRWASQRINAGQTTPWVTTEPAGDLASCSVYHAIQRSDGTFKRRVYLGTKVDAWTIDCSMDSTVATLNLQLSASVPQGNQFDSSTDPTNIVFPTPADNNFAIDPYLFIHTSGVISIGGSVRNNITQLTAGAQNVLARSYFNSRFIQKLRFVGRKSTLGVKLEYAATPDDRTAYEGLTSEAVSVAFANGTRTMTLSMNAQNVFEPMDDDLVLNDLYFQASTLNNLWDPSAGADLAFTFA